MKPKHTQTIMQSINPFDYTETKVSFKALELPFLIEAWGPLLLNHFKVKLYNPYDPKSLIVEMMGESHLQPINYASNRLNLPEELLRDIFLMSKNRVLIEAFSKRGQHPEVEKEEWGGKSMYHWEDFDRKNAVEKFKANEEEINKKLLAKSS